MMALRIGANEYALIKALDGPRASRRLSRAIVIAVVFSVCFHLGLLAYLLVEKVVVAPAATEPDPIMTIHQVTLAPVRPLVPIKLGPRRTIVTHPTVVNPIQPPPEQTVVTQTHLQPITAVGPTQLANVAPLPPPAKLIVDPKWLSQPTAAEMSRYYPARDIDLGVTGLVALVCGVVATGKLADCHVITETPSRAGFGDAALKVAGFFRMSPRTVDGQPVDGGLTRITITFKLADPD